MKQIEELKNCFSLATKARKEWKEAEPIEEESIPITDNFRITFDYKEERVFLRCPYASDYKSGTNTLELTFDDFVAMLETFLTTEFKKEEPNVK